MLSLGKPPALTLPSPAPYASFLRALVRHVLLSEAPQASNSCDLQDLVTLVTGPLGW